MTSRTAGLSDLPTLPAELLGSVPRDVRLTAGGIVLVSLATAAGLGALVAGMVMAVVYVRSGDERHIRELGSAAADATVVQVVVRRGDGPRRVVTYRFDADSRSHTGRTTLRKSDRRVLKQGDPVRIGYLLSRPDENWMIGYEPTGFPLLLIPLTVLSLLAISNLLLWNVRRQWTLLSEGRVARARVTGSQRVQSDKGRRFRVNYEFQTLSGATQQSRCEVGNAPAIGTVVPVVYHRDQPEWSAMYPMKLVRPGRLVP